MKIIIKLIFITFLTVSATEAKECTKMEAFAAESVVDYLNSWKEIYKAFKEFGHCDDGAIEEGFDEAISVQWADQWKTLPEMIKYTKEDTEFIIFIYKRIGTETVPFDRWEIIVNKAKADCPKIAQEFCNEIIKTENEKR
jgi:hypothetical protein